MNAIRWFARVAPLVLAAALIDCHTAPPTGPEGFLTGSWSTFNTAGYFEIALKAAGGVVTGTALDRCCGTGDIETHGDITGTYGGGGFTLQFSFPHGAANWFWMGTSATWTGQLTEIENTDALQGPFMVTAPVDSLLGTHILIREPSN
ncbi:MAG TPA: hypothetical protein VH163_09395 [Gemmatimonadales bacterium]|nr:hypothetical protein [Gemmatimonadales bacterium]